MKKRYGLAKAHGNTVLVCIW